MKTNRGRRGYLAKNVARLRAEKGWTQRECAARAGVGVAMIESGLRQSPHHSTLKKLARVFKVSIATLFDEPPAGSGKNA